MTTPDSTADTMRVRIRDRASEAPWGVGPTAPIVRTVYVPARCPRCGGERGEPSNLNQYDDGVHYSVDVWRNPCGHVDRYEDVMREARAHATGEPRPVWTFDPAAPVDGAS